MLSPWQGILMLSRDVSLLVAEKKKNPCRAVRNRVCISCGMIPTWQQNLNIIVHWTMKRNGVSGCSLPHSPPFPFCVFLVTLKIVKSLSWKKNTKTPEMVTEDGVSLILLIGRRPVPVWAKCFRVFSEDGRTMCFWANKNVAHKSLPRHRGQSEMVCKRIIVTPMAL